MTARRAEGGTVTTHLDDRSGAGDGAEAERPGADAQRPDAAADAAEPTPAPAPAAHHEPAATTTWLAAIGGPDAWDQPPAAPLRTPMPTQSTLSRLGDVLVSPFGRHRRATMVLLSLAVLALLVWVAVAELLVAPGASQSLFS